MKTSRSTNTGSSNAESQAQPTAGELFADGRAIELVMNSNELTLLFWDGAKASVLPQVDYRGRSYRPIQLHPSLQRAIRLPRGAVDYGSPGELFAGVASLFQRYIGFSKPEAMVITLWNASTWFTECLFSPPPLLVSGLDMEQAVRFFLLLHSLSRHALLLTGLSRSAIRSLPMALRPTLLVNQPDLPSPIRALWHCSNFRGMVVPGNTGTLLGLAGSKALYMGIESVPHSWDDVGVRVALPPAQRELPPLDEGELAEIANQWQPKHAMFRLRNFHKVRESGSAPGPPKFPATQFGRSLVIFAQDEPDVAKTAALLLQRQEQDARAQRGCDVNLVLIEVTWAPSHQEKEITLKRVTKLTNTLLRDRGELLVYSEVELGWRLKNLGIYRHRNGDGMVLRFSRENRVRIHQLARHLGLNLPAIAGCPDCAPTEVAAG